MKTKQKRTKVVVITLALAGLLLAFSLIGYAGNLEPSAPPGPTMKTLDEIYAAATSSGEAAPVSGTEFAADDRNIIAMSIGEFPGSGFPDSDSPDLEDACKIIHLEHTISQAFDPLSGQPTGVRVHSALRVVKVLDKATPGLHKALCTGQNLSEVTINFYRIDPPAQQEAIYYKITLRNARIVEIGPLTAFVTPDSYRHMEQVSFVYEEIEWNWLPDSIVEMDKWGAPGA